MGNAFCSEDDALSSSAGTGGSTDTTSKKQYPIPRQAVLQFAQADQQLHGLKEDDALRTLRRCRAEAAARIEAKRLFDAQNLSKTGVLTWREMRQIYKQSWHESEAEMQTRFRQLHLNCSDPTLPDHRCDPDARLDELQITSEQFVNFWMQASRHVLLVALWARG